MITITGKNVGRNAVSEKRFNEAVACYFYGIRKSNPFPGICGIIDDISNIYGYMSKDDDRNDVYHWAPLLCYDLIHLITELYTYDMSVDEPDVKLLDLFISCELCAGKAGKTIESLMK